MGTYRFSEEAKDDLAGIHQYGVREFGETQADDYFWKIIQKLDVVAESPLLYQQVHEIREGYRRSVCGGTRSTSASTVPTLILWPS